MSEVTRTQEGDTVWLECGEFSARIMRLAPNIYSTYTYLGGEFDDPCRTALREAIDREIAAGK